MNRKTKGRLAEAKVLAHLVESGYEVYVPLSDGSKYDVLTFKDGVILRISVKYTSTRTASGRWSVGLRNVSRRKAHIQSDRFTHHLYDLLAVYIGPEDRVTLVPVISFTADSELTVD